jgi:hypothetical protein
MSSPQLTPTERLNAALLAQHKTPAPLRKPNAARLTAEEASANDRASQQRHKARRLARRGNLPKVAVDLSPARTQALYGVADREALPKRPQPPTPGSRQDLESQLASLRREAATTQRAIDYYLDQLGLR